MKFACSPSDTDMRNKYILVWIGHFSGWVIVTATQQETAHVAVKFVQGELWEHFGAQRNTVTDNGPAFVAIAFCEFLRSSGTNWRTTSEYAPQVDGKAECRVKTMKRALGNLVQSSSKNCDVVISSILQM